MFKVKHSVKIAQMLGQFPIVQCIWMRPALVHPLYISLKDRYTKMFINPALHSILAKHLNMDTIIKMELTLLIMTLPRSPVKVYLKYILIINS